MVHVTGGLKIVATLTKLLWCNIQVFPNGQKYEGQWANDMRRARRRDHGQTARLACQSTFGSTCHFILRQKTQAHQKTWNRNPQNASTCLNFGCEAACSLVPCTGASGKNLQEWRRNTLGALRKGRMVERFCWLERDNVKYLLLR